MFAFLIVCLLRSSYASTTTFVFSAGPNTYVAFDSWRPCLTGYVRFDIRTTSQDGTLAYIDDRGKFDFFYLKLIEGKPRLLFNLGNDRQALNVNTSINDDQWHTILIQRHGQLTTLSIDAGRSQTSTTTNAEDLYFGGSTRDEYESSPFYFGGNPSSTSTVEISGLLFSLSLLTVDRRRLSCRITFTSLRMKCHERRRQASTKDAHIILAHVLLSTRSNVLHSKDPSLDC